MIATKAYAAQNATSNIAPWTLERRDLKADDVHIEILYCGVCHSDIHTARNEWGGTIYPVVPGHEIVGKVKAVGPEVTRFKIGDIAGVGCLVDSCQNCQNCAEGLEQYCENGFVGTYNGLEKDTKAVTYGGYSNQIVTREKFVFTISEKLDLKAVAPLLCAGITTYSPLRHWKVGKGHRVAVLGLGGLGHMAVKFAASFDAEVTMLSTSPSKEADAKRLGAQRFALTTDPAQLKGLMNHFDFIVDTVSAEHDYMMYMNMLRTNGVMICVGAPPTPAQVSAFALIFKRRSLVGSLIGGIPETQEMLDYCAEHGIVCDVEMIRMDQINEAYERMLRGDVKYRFVIDMATI
ncbi:MAG: NAD(P)-dependent alcohol dehydrogenase [Microscillaceae bacterium]|nr:NAD(P)-dependent alcohol dehydrogenase [Microscillaceae bacterium]